MELKEGDYYVTLGARACMWFPAESWGLKIRDPEQGWFPLGFPSKGTHKRYRASKKEPASFPAQLSAQNRIQKGQAYYKKAPV